MGLTKSEIDSVIIPANATDIVNRIELTKNQYNENIQQLPELRYQLEQLGIELTKSMKLYHNKVYSGHENSPFALFASAQNRLMCHELISVPDVTLVKVPKRRKPKGMKPGSVRWVRAKRVAENNKV